MTCNDCIYAQVCGYRDQLDINPVYYAEQCEDFKDRSQFMDITEIEQNVIRPLCNRCAALTNCQTCLACAVEIRKHCKHHKQAEQAAEQRKPNRRV